jgi:hypothetical protein
MQKTLKKTMPFPILRVFRVAYFLRTVKKKLSGHLKGGCFAFGHFERSRSYAGCSANST